MKKIALSYAMEGEIVSILEQTGAKKMDTVCGIPFYEIEENILAYAGGIGKVNAAMAAQLCIDRFHPDFILNAGVAGSFLDLPIGTVVVAKDFIQHDVDTSAVGDPVGLVSTVNVRNFATQYEEIRKVLNAQGVAHEVGTVATGDVFLVRGQRANWIKETFAPTLCEMEGGAIAQVCMRNNVSFGAVKSVSDRLTMENSHEEYFNFGEAMAKLNSYVLPLAIALRDAE